MATRPRIRKRVCSIRRAPDGSAYEKCEKCGIAVAVALTDMHECEPKKDVKRFKGRYGNRRMPNPSFGDQPISPFRLFMERFMENCKSRNLIEIDRRGFETWKNMSKEERQPYVSEAEKVNSAWQEALTEEVNNLIPVNDEADSAKVGKFDQFQRVYEGCSEYSSQYTWFDSDGILESWTSEDS